MIKITAIGNAGFSVFTNKHRIYFDAFYHPIPGVAGRAAVQSDEVRQADVLLVTHAHPDHFDPEEVAKVSRATGAKVVGPAPVIKAMAGLVPTDRLIDLTPAGVPRGHLANAVRWESNGIAVTAFGTCHGSCHNSYMVETPEVRFFDDGDNEKTGAIPVEALGELDALFIAPWQGSGWVEFIEKTKTPRWFIIHLTGPEIREHERGEFFTGLCDHVPAGLVALKPGEEYRIGDA